MDIQLVFALLGAAFGLGSFVPYVRDIAWRGARPHIYTWVIWCITQGIATAAAWQQGGWGAYNLLLGTLACGFIVVLSLRYGSRDITRSDTVLLLSAGAAIIVWWQLQDALLALFVATAIDIAGYLPTYRKTWRDPASETPLAWAGFTLAFVFALLALESYTLLTATYLVAITLANALVLALALRNPYGRTQ